MRCQLLPKALVVREEKNIPQTFDPEKEEEQKLFSPREKVGGPAVRIY